MRHQKPSAMLRLMGRSVMDGLGGLIGRPPLLVPLVGEPGTVAMLTTPDSLDADRALNPGNGYPDWQQAAAARFALRLGFYRPGRDAPRVKCPLLVVVCDQDQSNPADQAVHAAQRAPHAQVVHLSGPHYTPFMGGHEQAVEAELSFLRRHLLDDAQPHRPVPGSAESARH
jgi:pimeloyl-ACP methyl ester carboxylesterase